MSSLSIAQPITVYAAGSLRLAMQDLKTRYAAETLLEANFLFGPSGKLREKIETGENPALFASAAPTHTERLIKAGTAYQLQRSEMDSETASALIMPIPAAQKITFFLENICDC